MSKCENCIHYDVCAELMAIMKNQTIAFVKECIGETNGCDHFKDKSLFVELPCKVGDKLFRIFTYKMKIHDYTITEFLFNGNEILIYGEGGYRECAICVDKEIGKTVFLTKEQAEQKLKELEK